MPHSLLTQYLREIETAARAITNGHVERYQEEILSSDRANLRIRIRFSNGCLLEITEAVIVENQTLQTPGYRYHLQDSQNILILRYDDTLTFPTCRRSLIINMNPHR
ncbi:MAG: DUF6516 family protein [candidate division KSB1 bacterium]|nr:DUF6516 family protein [candidate division KSB1 bacterium]MDZ7364684.1 DUF6516 family protein [candidate division KSB1 bacterium]MDZ7402568.1 DUF6516 family protein [candidate division KSB1 bacterium]